MSLPIRSDFLRLSLDPDRFLWGTGIEDTFIIDPHPLTGRTLDEYELTGHYEQWEGDLQRAAELGVSILRYGIPWYRVEPRPGAFLMRRWSGFSQTRHGPTSSASTSIRCSRTSGSSQGGAGWSSGCRTR